LALSDPNAFEQALERTALLVESNLGTVLPDDSSRLSQAIRYAALGGGKRLRPFFVLESAAVFGIPPEAALPVAAALECIHCYSLVHDDLPAMDNDDLRRGRPTVHRQYDDATAILVGDALLTLAFEILAKPAEAIAADIQIELISKLAQAAGASGMVGGQMLDIEAETRNFASLEAISAMQSAKTGALFHFACESGAYLAKASPEALRQYADHIGLAFQITDDILDVESNAAALGKATQKDKAKGKATFVDFLGLEGARTEAQRRSEAAVDSLSIYGNRADLLCAAARYVVTRRK
jgi:farnesyl diphosphate synthase